MNNGEIVTVNGVEIDTRKIDILLRKLIMKEKVNIKTRQYNDVEMVKLIKKMIEEEAKCY
ncbi:hypothetical protein Dform_00310 [Dehalogenimonas formicexedens]|uniref:Uncharacterized protein n=1 Tax=Dehalogenimonas formicexedens TaxID=1839801 RepID=A0A1P8F5G7_9CHLR|nr:hypothetical protein [Dehalogenimonas formicexedens]APV43670.1 hypothetical protein Dform_00310 [Dehalogenimonas formicexedens]